MIYWHIQMNQPWGRDEGTIESIDMLKQTQPVIGTGDWEDIQCYYFKGTNPQGLKIGDIIVVHEGKKAIALCKVTSDSFVDPNLASKFHHENYRLVKVLDYFNGKLDFPQPQGTLERLINPNTSSWKFIDSWHSLVIKKNRMDNIVKVLTQKKQIILQGPPGTGKTFTAQDIAYYLIFNKQLSSDPKFRKAELLNIETNEQYQFVQFHPSFTYEDFVRGITAKPSSNSTGIMYQAEDKLFGNFAKLAYQNMLDSKKSIETISLEKWIKNKTYDYQAYLDEQLNANDGRQKLTEKVYIYKTDENGIRYKGDNWSIDSGVPFSDLVEMYKAKIKTRQDVKNLQTLSATAKWNSTYWLAIFNFFDEYVTSLNETPPVSEIIAEKKYVMVIDEINRANLPSVLGELIYALEYRDHTVKSMYELAIGGNDLLLPSNLYIIGTMNTADRSVGHIDYAIRRRFAFVPVLPDASIITYPLALAYFKEIGNLIEAHRASDFEFNDIMLGHSYFLADNDADLKVKLRYEVYPILKEYLKDGLLNKNDESEALLKVLYEKIESINE